MIRSRNHRCSGWLWLRSCHSSITSSGSTASGSSKISVCVKRVKPRATRSGTAASRSALAKGMRWRGIVDSCLEAGRTVTPIMLLLLTATMFSKLVALNGLPQEVQGLLDAWGLGPTGTIVFIVAVWFLLGCMIDSISIMLLTMPVFWPIANALGLDPIVFALVGILVIEAGVLRPPFGLSVFVVKASAPDPQLTVGEIFRGVTPYWILILVVAWLIYAWPPLATWLPSHM